MSKHPDAIGYIRDLGHSENISWLEMICDLAASGETTISSSNLEVLVQLFKNRASYLRQPAPSLATSTGAIAPINEHLEKIGPFNEFKRLRNSLSASFPKQVTIIFGANGSGKSSICEALQILASNDAPKRPFHDVRDKTKVPSFSFKFASDVTEQSWRPPAAYGSYSSVLKYFDTGIAINNIQNSVQPGRIIELSPFKLDVFETAKNHCIELRTELQSRQDENANCLSIISEKIRMKFSEFEGFVLADLATPTTDALDTEIKLGNNYSEESGLDKKLERKADLKKATSEEGIKLLKGEVATLKALHGEVEPLLVACKKLIEINPVELSKELQTKETKLKVLAEILIPTGTTLEKLMALIRPANEICSLHFPERTECPLCKQELRESELELFKQYSTLLTDELNTDITELRKNLQASEENIKVIAESSPESWAKGSVLEPETIDPIRDAGKAIKREVVLGREIDQKCIDVAETIQNVSVDLLKRLEKKKNLIEKAENDRENLVEQLNRISAECKRLLYAREIANNIVLVKEAYSRTTIAIFWDTNLPNFTPVLRKITTTAKTAHKELVVEDFKTRLNAEYLELAEKDMNAFGVELKDVGGDGAVTLEPHVKGQDIETVLSEGEQRIHALALFFAEIETSEQQVIVFDDPISSFDYNYIGNYCNRLRNFIQNHPNRQVIVFTHNWEFFMEIQKTIKDVGMVDKMSVNVLENCASIDDYSEKIPDLKAKIEGILNYAQELTTVEKEFLAGNMRRLLEAVVNTHVFNNQRHQFKQKSQPISVFHEFTQIVPLRPSEANTLRELYSKLSVTEHDDPRNAYVSTDKAMFQKRYESIKKIEVDILSRK